jgi:DNA-binding MarR family transcriptional regulator
MWVWGEVGILMFAFIYTAVSYGRWINQRLITMRPMPDPNALSELEQRTLLALWRLKGLGKNGVEESSLQTELTSETPQNLTGAVQALENLGFITKSNSGERKLLSLTPLGLAILRKLEEDRLQELK